MSPGISTRLLATQSDERLLRLVREGHERAFEALVNRYRKPLLSYCRRLSLPEARTEDVLQQALLKTWIALSDGAEVRDIKAWLYRVVHNAALNAVRDAAHDRERVADPTLRVGGVQADLEHGLAAREALAEVAALPPLQREVIVRTAVGGYSHEQVASDLGITDGAVRGLLYRARATLRTATTALTPPQLVAWLVGRADQGSGAPERLSELAAGGGTVGFGGLLVKGGVAAVTAGTLLTGAAVVHLQSTGHHRHRPAGVTSGSSRAAAASSPAPETITLGASTSPRPSGAGGTGGRGARALDTSLVRSSGSRGSGGSTGSGHEIAIVQRRKAATAPDGSPGAPSESVVVETKTSAGSNDGGASQGSAGSGAGSSPPQGEPAGSASGAGSGAEAPSGGSGTTQTPAGSEPSETETPSGAGGSTESSGSSGSSSQTSGSQESGGLVKTVVHEVGNVIEHLLH